MSKQWVRQQIKKNEVQETVEHVIDWMTVNRRQASIFAGSAIGALVLAVIFLYGRHARNDAAWNALALANGYAYANQEEVALKKIDELNAEYPAAPASGYGLLFAGDILSHRARYPESAKYFTQLLDRGQPKSLLPFALNGLVLGSESAGQCPEAAKTAERFLQNYPDHFLAPQVHSSLARCQEAMGQTDTAKTTLQKIMLQYPDSSWASWAQERLKSAGSAGA